MNLLSSNYCVNNVDVINVDYLLKVCKLEKIALKL